VEVVQVHQEPLLRREQELPIQAVEVVAVKVLVLLGVQVVQE